MLSLKSITFQQACDFVSQLHRHHQKPQGWKYGVGVVDENDKLVGVAMVGRPVSRFLDDGETVEVIRLCTDGTKNACSMLYSACARAAKALGSKRIITYILESESGDSLRASGWTFDSHVKGKTWNNNVRSRIDKHPLVDKQRWVKQLC